MASTGQQAALCSTGEQKAMLIAMTLAHADLASEGRPAVMLLDEVAAHLDPVRRDALFERLRRGRAQVGMTGTEAAPFADVLGEAAVWREGADLPIQILAPATEGGRGGKGQKQTEAP